MWALGALEDSSPEVLLNTVWFLLTLYMGLHGRDEHYKLTTEILLSKQYQMAPNMLNLIRETPKYAQVRLMQADNLSPKCGAPQIIYLVAHFVFLKCFFKSAPQKCALLNHLFIWL